MFDYDVDDQYGTIVELEFVLIGEVVLCWRFTLAFSFGKVQSICVEQEHIIDGIIVYGRVGITGNIVKKLFTVMYEFLFDFGLYVRNGAEGCGKSWINCTAIL